MSQCICITDTDNCLADSHTCLCNAPLPGCRFTGEHKCICVGSHCWRGSSSGFFRPDYPCLADNHGCICPDMEHHPDAICRASDHKCTCSQDISKCLMQGEQHDCSCVRHYLENCRRGEDLSHL